ncbi:MAG: YceI family protein [Marinilabiliaceae bacterium]|nr:YceI family protein [Marinilabiliaceae bacterium]
MKAFFMGCLFLISFSPKVEHYELNPDRSNVIWQAGNHNGVIKFTEGYIEIKNSVLVKGVCIIDMTTLKNIDIQNKELSKMLDDHLKSKHYFNVEKYPVATLDIQKSTNIDISPVMVTGMLAIKNVKRKITFEVVPYDRYFEGEVKVDRVEEFFDSIGKSMAPDNIILTVKIHLEQKSS